MSNNRAFIIALGMTGGSIFILAEAWYGTAGNIWLSAGVLLAVILLLYLYWRLYGHRVDAASLNRLGWVWVSSIALLNYLHYRTNYTNRPLHLVGVFIYSVALAVGLAELKRWLDRRQGGDN